MADVKRLVDLVGAGTGLLVSLPLLLIIGLWVRSDSPGPVLFRQIRIGRHGRPFAILKFRTMTHDSSGAVQITATNDSRITGAGHWLRRTKLDELPQLANVLMGQMSLVGPRPEVPRYVAMYPPEIREQVLSVRPGLTDAASIEFRDEGAILARVTDPESVYVNDILPRKLAMHVQYVRDNSIAGDFRIMFQTLTAVLQRRMPHSH